MFQLSDMTLKDYFASLAMQAMLTNGKFRRDDIAKRSYEYANMLLEEKAKQEKGNSNNPTINEMTLKGYFDGEV